MLIISGRKRLMAYSWGPTLPRSLKLDYQNFTLLEARFHSADRMERWTAVDARSVGDWTCVNRSGFLSSLGSNGFDVIYQAWVLMLYSVHPWDLQVRLWRQYFFPISFLLGYLEHISAFILRVCTSCPSCQFKISAAYLHLDFMSWYRGCCLNCKCNDKERTFSMICHSCSHINVATSKRNIWEPSRDILSSRFLYSSIMFKQSRILGCNSTCMQENFLLEELLIWWQLLHTEWVVFLGCPCHTDRHPTYLDKCYIEDIQHRCCIALLKSWSNVNRDPTSRLPTSRVQSQRKSEMTFLVWVASLVDGLIPTEVVVALG